MVRPRRPIHSSPMRLTVVTALRDCTPGPVHPGVIMETELSRHEEQDTSGAQTAIMADSRFEKITKNVGQGAATQVWAAVAKVLEGKCGKFSNDVHVAEPADKDTPLFMNGFLSHIYNKESAVRLWNDSLKMVGLPGDKQQCN